MATFWSIAEDRPGPKWQALFERLWPAYRRWFDEQSGAGRPTYLECRRAMRHHMPELAPVYDELCQLAGGGDMAARFLSLFCPPAYLSGCSQALWPGEEPMLVRNYDYSQHAFDGVLLKSSWLGKPVMGMSDCLVGLVDGINADGLALSLTFGGSREVGQGFGVPIILRYILETCATTAEAVAVLERIPSHMAYNVTIVDAGRSCRTAYLAPGRDTIVSRTSVATNHQERVEWRRHARLTATVERERFLLQRLTLHEEPQEAFIAAFLKPPLYSLAFARGFGTLYTAAYWPCRQTVRLCWSGASWQQSLAEFREEAIAISYPVLT